MRPITDLSAYGPWAVITGASSGIGRAFAEHCAADGLNLVLAARSTDRLEDLGRTLTLAHKIEHRVVTVDLSRANGAADLIAASEDLDVGLLISNAGTGRPGRFLDQNLPDLHQRLTLNTTTHLELAHAFGRRFVQRGRGAMVLVSALGAMYELPNMAHESAAKSYVLNLGEALHSELRPAGVRVTVIALGADRVRRAGTGMVFGVVVWLVMQYAVWKVADPTAAPLFTPWVFALGHLMYGAATGLGLSRTSAEGRVTV